LDLIATAEVHFSFSFFSLSHIKSKKIAFFLTPPHPARGRVLEMDEELKRV